MSFGSEFSPHDGTTLQEQILDTKSDNSGLVLVAGAGNAGQNKQHAYLDLLSSEPLFLLNRNNHSSVNSNQDTSQSLFNFWGESGGVNSAFEVGFQIFNSDTGTLESDNALFINVDGSFQTEEPIQLQDHGNLVSFRNIWLRKLKDKP